VKHSSFALTRNEFVNCSALSATVHSRSYGANVYGGGLSLVLAHSRTVLRAAWYQEALKSEAAASISRKTRSVLALPLHQALTLHSPTGPMHMEAAYRKHLEHILTVPARMAAAASCLEKLNSEAVVTLFFPIHFMPHNHQ
jgi:hypothetical protein